MDAAVRIYSLIWQGPVCADSQDRDPDQWPLATRMVEVYTVGFQSKQTEIQPIFCRDKLNEKQRHGKGNFLNLNVQRRSVVAICDFHEPLWAL